MSLYATNAIHGAVPSGTEYMGTPARAGMRGMRRRFKWWYDDIIDWMLLNPGRPMKDCAKQLNRAVSTLSIVTSSDIFRARLAERRREYSLRLADGIADASSEVALLALREVQSRLSNNPDAIPIGMVADIADKALNRLGYGVAPLAAVPTAQVNVNVQISPSALRDAQETLRRVQQINATVVEVKEPLRVTDNSVQPATISSQ